MKPSSPGGKSPVLPTWPSLMMELQDLAGDSRSVLLQLVGAWVVLRGAIAETCPLTLRLPVEQGRSRDQRSKASGVPRRRSLPRALCPWNGPLKRTPPVLSRSSFAGDRRCLSTRGWRRCSYKCTGRSHDPIGSLVLQSE